MEDGDGVGAADGGESVGDHDRRPPTRHAPKALLDVPLRRRVQRGRRLSSQPPDITIGQERQGRGWEEGRRGGEDFVEEDDGGLLEERPGDGHPLLLAPAQLQPPLAHHRLVPSRSPC